MASAGTSDHAEEPLFGLAGTSGFHKYVLWSKSSSGLRPEPVTVPKSSLLASAGTSGFQHVCSVVEEFLVALAGTSDLAEEFPLWLRPEPVAFNKT